MELRNYLEKVCTGIWICICEARLFTILSLSIKVTSLYKLTLHSSSHSNSPASRASIWKTLIIQLYLRMLKLLISKLSVLCSKTTPILSLVNLYTRRRIAVMLNLVTQQLSVAVHTLRSMQFHVKKIVQVV